MLNPIPIQFLAPLAYFILRFGVGVLLFHIALQLWQQRERFSSVIAPEAASYLVAPLVVGKVVIALMLLFGWYTQYAAIALMLMSLDLMITRRWVMHPALPARPFYALLFFVAVSLCITGAGALAVDLPI